jgi:signal transduction histidine kinase
MAHPYWYVLLVDDDEDDYYLIREQLEQTQVRSITLAWADTYENAQTQLASERFDAVLVDYRLGAQTGTELIREMTERSYPAPFILLTGVGSYEVDVEAMQAGATAYISKTEANSLLLERTIRYAVERKHAEEALRAARDEARAAEGALQARNEEIEVMTQQLWQTAKLATMGELAASIAHELNNPLQILSLRLENLESQLPDPGIGRKDIPIMKGEIYRMADLVSNLLQFSRSGGQQITSLDIREEIDRTLDLVNNHLLNRHISVQREFAVDLPMIRADRQQIRQLFLNLFTNASDAMRGGGTLTIRAWTDPERFRVFIEIQDTGIGIAPENLSKVMQPFFTTKPEGRGTGLGLAICRRIVEEHQGSLEISSPGTGQGTLIRVALPSAIDRGTGFLLETEEG